MATRTTFECPSCDREFDSEHGMKVHHTATHGESLVQIECSCETCDAEFSEFKSRVDRGKGRFCSKECQYASGRVEVTCDYCGETVLRPEHRAGRYENEYCSIECNREHLREGGEAAPGWNGGAKVTKSCDTCGDSVTRGQSQFYDTVYCSNKCMSEGRKGEGHHNWVGGTITWYGENWSEQREKALERDNRRCQSCGMAQAEHREIYDRDLSVHHLNPIRNFRDSGELDYEAANKLSNLMTVCMRCHRNLDKSARQSEEVAA